ICPHNNSYSLFTLKITPHHISTLFPYTTLFRSNAQGKTNILEALYVSATTKSHRASTDKELIRFEQQEAHIRVHLKKKDVPHKIDRKSTRLNSSHVSISYAVFCLKKKIKQKTSN